MTIHLCHQGRQLGSFSKEQVEGMLKAGIITDVALAWVSGMAEWKPLLQVLQPDTPPPIPPRQTAAATAFELADGCPSPTDDKPKRGLPSPTSAPPVIAAPAFEARLSEPVRQEIQKLAKVPFGQMIAWTLFILGIASIAGASETGSLAEPNPFVLVAIICGIFVFRSWCKRRTMRVILNRGVLRCIYWPALWSFGWRNICTGMGVALVFGIGANSPNEQVSLMLLLFIFWIFLSFFVIDIPYRSLRRVKRIAETARATTMPPTESKGQDTYRPVAVTTGSRSSLWPIISVIIVVLFIVAGGVWFWLAQAPASEHPLLRALTTEQQHYNENLAGLVKSGTDVNSIKQLQDSHYTNMMRMETSLSDADSKMLFEATKPIFDQATELRQKWEDDMKRLEDQDFVDPATLTDPDVLMLRFRRNDTLRRLN